MITPDESLVKYNNPVSIKNTDRKSSTSKSASADDSKQENEILNRILPPREWMEGNQLWMQHVSSAPCTRIDVIRLEEELDMKLQQWLAKKTGICPVRGELYSQCIDELIRQVTINCAERGLLLLRVRDEIQMTIDVYQTVYEGSVAFGIRRVLQAEQGKADMEKTICDLEEETRDLKKQLNEQRAIYEAFKRKENEKRQLDDKKHSEDIKSMNRTNQQLKNQLEEILTPEL